MSIVTTRDIADALQVSEGTYRARRNTGNTEYLLMLTDS